MPGYEMTSAGTLGLGQRRPLPSAVPQGGFRGPLAPHLRAMAAQEQARQAQAMARAISPMAAPGQSPDPSSREAALMDYGRSGPMPVGARANLHAFGDTGPGTQDLYGVSGAAFNQHAQQSNHAMQGLLDTQENDRINRAMGRGALLAGREPAPYQSLYPGARPTPGMKASFNLAYGPTPSPVMPGGLLAGPRPPSPPVPKPPALRMPTLPPMAERTMEQDYLRGAGPFAEAAGPGRPSDDFRDWMVSRIARGGKDLAGGIGSLVSMGLLGLDQPEMDPAVEHLSNVLSAPHLAEGVTPEAIRALPTMGRFRGGIGRLGSRPSLPVPKPPALGVPGDPVDPAAEHIAAMEGLARQHEQDGRHGMAAAVRADIPASAAEIRRESRMGDLAFQKGQADLEHQRHQNAMMADAAELGEEGRGLYSQYSQGLIGLESFRKAMNDIRARKAALGGGPAAPPAKPGTVPPMASVPPTSSTTGGADHTMLGAETRLGLQMPDLDQLLAADETGPYAGYQAFERAMQRGYGERGLSDPTSPLSIDFRTFLRNKLGSEAWRESLLPTLNQSLLDKILGNVGELTPTHRKFQAWADPKWFGSLPR